MKKMYPCIETTLDFDYFNQEIRLWINKESLMLPTYPLLPDTIKLIFETHKITENTFNLPLVFAEISKLPNINAVQISQKAKEGEPQWGTVVYTVDFEDNKG